MIEKKKIQQNFNTASLTYDSAATIQRTAAEILVTNFIKYFNTFHPCSILDVGAGTGYVTKLLLRYFPNSLYSLNDLAENMLKQAKNNLSIYKNIKVYSGDMENINFDFHSLIISNMALQWASDLNNIIKKLFLNSNILAFSCLLKGTFKEWDDIFTKISIPISIYRYPIKAELEQELLSLHPSKYFFEAKNFVLKFNNTLDFIKYLKNLGAQTSSYSLAVRDLKALLKYNYQFNITYKIFFGILER